jgi:hypothetical protein
MREVMTGSRREVDDNFDVVRSMLHRFRPAFERHMGRPIFYSHPLADLGRQKLLAAVMLIVAKVVDALLAAVMCTNK